MLLFHDQLEFNHKKSISIEQFFRCNCKSLKEISVDQVKITLLFTRLRTSSACIIILNKCNGSVVKHKSTREEQFVSEWCSDRRMHWVFTSQRRRRSPSSLERWVGGPEAGRRLKVGQVDSSVPYISFCLAHSGHKMSEPSVMKPLPTSEPWHMAQMKQSLCQWRSSKEINLVPPIPAWRRWGSLNRYTINFRNGLQ